ncbi:energy-coupling factor transporter transmembrane protein EcfT [Thermococcus sp.]|uniref:energy-coupling factor transporter transmembrane component T family protein n=1 Tax=Thermococcus sp. TaxID=35749 RepID=UPI002607FCDC|nr:energy-coupling factor transporter transmembrane component T [Thermococcus sp.]
MMYSFYVERDSLLHRLDPRVKIVGSGAGIAAMLLFNDPAVLMGLFFLILFGGRFLGRTGIKEQLKLLKPIFPISMITVILWPIIYTPRLRGLLFGISFGFRLLTFALVTFLLLMTTQQRDLILGFVRLGLPYEFGLTVSIALRYIPTLYLLATNIMDAQKSRGWEMEKGNMITRIRKTTVVLIPLLISSLKTAHELSIALESRALGASKKRTFLHDIRMERRDYAAMATVLLLLAAALYIRYGLGMGHIIIHG